MSPRPEHNPRRGFTLVEMTFAMAITAVLLLTMAAVIVATASAADTGNDAAAAQSAAGEKLGQLNAELGVATQITALTPTDILFTVPDRTGDGAADTIEYTWSGTPGAAMMRIFNGSPATTFIPTVQTLDVTSVLRAPAVPVESAEQVLAGCDLPLGSSLQTFSVDPSLNNYAAAQYVRPAMPASASAWKITQVGLVLARGNSNKTFNITVYGATTSLKPTTTVLAQVSVGTNSLSGLPAWITLPIGPITGLIPGQGVCLVVETTGAANAHVSVGYVQGGSAQPFNAHAMFATGSPTGWSAPSDGPDLRFIVYGTITTMVEP